MIFFCEDCGEKNDLTPAHLKQGKAVFKCRFCNYANAYTITPPKRKQKKKTPDFFEEIKLFPEIIGSFLFHRKKGVLKNDMPGILKKKDLAVLGSRLTDSISSCALEYPDVEEMTVIISNKTLVVRMLDSDLAVIIAGKTSPLSQPVVDRPVGCFFVL